MNDLGLGKLITTPQQRDAIHVAVVPVVASEKLFPGWHVGINGDGEGVHGIDPCGIVDPFLPTVFVKKGETFWLFMFPNTVTNLRHDWSHPSFPVVENPSQFISPKRDESIVWLTEFANGYDMTYDSLIKRMTGDDPRLPTDLSGDELSEFWDHIQHATGFPVDSELRRYTPCGC